MPPAFGTTPTDRDDFICEVAYGVDRATVSLSGELDMLNVEEVEGPLRDLARLGFRDVVVDLRRLTFLDSSGIALLVRWQRLSHADGFRFGVVLGDERVRRPLEITGVLGLLEVIEPPGD